MSRRPCDICFPCVTANFHHWYHWTEKCLEDWWSTLWDISGYFQWQLDYNDADIINGLICRRIQNKVSVKNRRYGLIEREGLLEACPLLTCLLPSCICSLSALPKLLCHKSSCYAVLLKYMGPSDSGVNQLRLWAQTNTSPIKLNQPFCWWGKNSK